MDGSGQAQILTPPSGIDDSGCELVQALGDVLDVDAMSGGAGDDTYSVDDVGDTVSEQASQGTDGVLSLVNFTLRSNVENLTLLASANTNGDVVTENSNEGARSAGGKRKRDVPAGAARAAGQSRYEQPPVRYRSPGSARSCV